MSEPDRTDIPEAEPKPAAQLETSIRRLQAIVETMEKGDIELDQALELFEEGVGHVRLSRTILEKSKLKVERLVEQATGDISTQEL